MWIYILKEHEFVYPGYGSTNSAIKLSIQELENLSMYKHSQHFVLPFFLSSSVILNFIIVYSPYRLILSNKKNINKILALPLFWFIMLIKIGVYIMK